MSETLARTPGVTYTSARLFPGECILPGCPVRAFRHQHKTQNLAPGPGELVTVHDPSGPMPGRVESVGRDGTVYIEGPSLGAGDSRVWSWQIASHLVSEFVMRRSSD